MRLSDLLLLPLTYARQRHRLRKITLLKIGILEIPFFFLPNFAKADSIPVDEGGTAFLFFFLSFLLAVSLIGGFAVFVSSFLRKILIPKFPEEKFSDLLPFLKVLDDQKTVLLKDGSLCSVLRFKGLSLSTKEEEDIKAEFKKQVQFLTRFFQKQCHARFIIRKKTLPSFRESSYKVKALQEISQKWQNRFKDNATLEFFIILEEPKSKFAQERLLKNIELLSDFFSRDRLEVLSNEPSQGGDSPLLSFLAEHLGQKETRIKPFQDDVSERLASEHIGFDRDGAYITFEDGIQKRYQRVISVLEWGHDLRVEMRDALLAIPGECELCQILENLPLEKASQELSLKHRIVGLFKRNPIIDEQFDEVKTIIESDEESLSNVQYTVVLKASSLEALDEMTIEAKSVLNRFGIRPVVEQAALIEIWRHRLPSCNRLIRDRMLMTSHIAQFLTFEDAPKGHASSCWGEGAIREFKTYTGGSYAFQFHVSQEKEAVAHGVIFAPTGSGKTTLIQHLIGGALRLEDVGVYNFDKQNGMEIFTKTAGGRYFDFARLADLSLNPFLYEDSPHYRLFLKNWMSGIFTLTQDQDLEACDFPTSATFVPK